ncbi:hypothetical protein MKX34_10260 [Paenibacillus sp. FSL R5-0636]|uniref:hypothetical protein n=1 Tax=Paenibacillus TaxID=44249 RepID=UPI00096C6040|nr:hypothetical protein [Paenibacillus odorifer]OMD05764.1 hypothetical protein BJP49_19520 [Paenibacillus odorifer]
MKNTGNLGLKKPEGTDLVDIDDLNYNADILDTAINNKVDKVTGKQLSTNDYTASEKTKLAGIATGATNYTHPATHPPSIIAQDASNRFVTDAEKAGWNGKAPNTLVSAAPQSDGLMRATDKIKLDGIATGANNYVHPANHPATMITEDATHRFATDTEKSNWNSKPNLVTTPQQTTSDLTYYVRTDGSDSNDGSDNTAAKAFKTITKAISFIPQIVNHAVTVNVAAGTYSEIITLSGYSGGGSISIQGDTVASSSRTVQAIAIINNSTRTALNGLNCNASNTNGVSISKSVYVEISYCNLIASAPTASGVDASASTVRVKGCAISNKGQAILSADGSRIHSDSNSGSGNTYALYVYQGAGLITQSGTQPSSTNGNGAATGLVLSSGVLNPWGDNTRDTRSAVIAFATSSQQTIAAATATKVNFGTEDCDNLDEFLNSRFTTKQSGIYQISALTTFIAQPATAACELYLYVDGVFLRRLALAVNGSSTSAASHATTGSLAVRLTAGQYVEIYARSSSPATLGGTIDTWFSAIRVA